jgi:hypothetical protein
MTNNLERSRTAILGLALDALDRRRRRAVVRRRARLAALAGVLLAATAWLLAPTPAPPPASPSIADRLGPEVRLLTDDELIELLESAGYRVELIRTPTSVMVRLNDGPLLTRPF